MMARSRGGSRKESWAAGGTCARVADLRVRVQVR
jgi:hypothetical protein